MKHAHEAGPEYDPELEPEAAEAAVEKALEKHQPGRRRSDSSSAQIGKLVIWLATALGAAGGGGWYVKNTAITQMAAAQEVIDQKARADLALLRVEIGGKLDLLAQQQMQMNEQLRELRHRP